MTWCWNWAGTVFVLQSCSASNFTNKHHAMQLVVSLMCVLPMFIMSWLSITMEVVFCLLVEQDSEKITEWITRKIGGRMGQEGIFYILAWIYYSDALMWDRVEFSAIFLTIKHRHIKRTGIWKYIYIYMSLCNMWWLDWGFFIGGLSVDIKFNWCCS